MFSLPTIYNMQTKQVGPTTHFKIDDTIEITDQMSPGYEYSQSISILAEGGTPSFERHTYKAFKKSIFEDPLVFPGLRYGHIEMGHSYLAKETDKYWKRAGKKISEEPRFSTAYTDPHPGGPGKPTVIKGVMSKPVLYFPRVRMKNPFKHAPTLAI